MISAVHKVNYSFVYHISANGVSDLSPQEVIIDLCYTSDVLVTNISLCSILTLLGDKPVSFLVF